MEIKECDKYELSGRVYGGRAGLKRGIVINGENFFVKYPDNLKIRVMKNVKLSYSNSPVCEYIGSHVYEILKVPVHETFLGLSAGKKVVVCKDFLKKGEQLDEFGKIKNSSFTDAFIDSFGNISNGQGTDLGETLYTIRNSYILKKFPKMEKHFWDMFIVDALIGNPDRNTSNWGIIKELDGVGRIAPVYDNGNCLHNKFDDEKFCMLMKDETALKNDAYNGINCIHELNGKRINPFRYMQGGYGECEKACIESVIELVPKINLEAFRNLIIEIPDEFISSIHKEYIITIIQKRYEDCLYPLYMKEKQYDTLIYKNGLNGKGLYLKTGEFISEKIGSKTEMEKRFGCKIKDPYDLLKGKSR